MSVLGESSNPDSSIQTRSSLTIRLHLVPPLCLTNLLCKPSHNNDLLTLNNNEENSQGGYQTSWKSSPKIFPVHPPFDSPNHSVFVLFLEIYSFILFTNINRLTCFKSALVFSAVLHQIPSLLIDLIFCPFIFFSLSNPSYVPSYTTKPFSCMIT